MPVLLSQRMLFLNWYMALQYVAEIQDILQTEQESQHVQEKVIFCHLTLCIVMSLGYIIGVLILFLRTMFAWYLIIRCSWGQLSILDRTSSWPKLVLIKPFALSENYRLALKNSHTLVMSESCLFWHWNVMITDNYSGLLNTAMHCPARD